MFDGEAMAVPTRVKLQAMTSHKLVSVDNIFQCFVHKVAEVKRTVCKRRTIVESKSRHTVRSDEWGRR